MIQNEKEICEFLNIPAIPKKKWDGVKDFATGIAVLELKDGLAYAVCTYDSERHEHPLVTRVFTAEQFNKVVDIFVVPSYMETDVDSMDLDEESKNMAKLLVDEAKETVDSQLDETFEEPKNEYYFDFIHNDEEAIAFIRAYDKKQKRGRSRTPKTHESILMRLSVMYSDLNKDSKHNEKAN